MNHDLQVANSNPEKYNIQVNKSLTKVKENDQLFHFMFLFVFLFSSFQCPRQLL